MNPENNTSIKYIMEKKKKVETPKENKKIFEYKNYKKDLYQIKKPKEKIDTTQNYRRKISEKKINNNLIKDNNTLNTIGYLSEKEDVHHQRNLSLNKINTNSSTIINNKSRGRIEIKDNNKYLYKINTNQKAKNDNKNVKISGFELFYESDKLKGNSNNNKYKYNININHHLNNRTLDYDIEKSGYSFNAKNNDKSSHDFRKVLKRNNNNDNSITNSNNVLSVSMIDNTNKRISNNKIKINNQNKIENINNYNNTYRYKIISDKTNIKFRNFHRRSEIKKIILIQSVYRAHFSQMKYYEYVNTLSHYKEFCELLNNIFIDRKKKLLKYLIIKIKGRKKKVKRNNNKIMNTKNKILIKANEMNMLRKELGDSFNIKNDDLKIKLDDIIKENNDLKNQIYDNKNIEEKMKQLLEENKKNQNINAIIMKDNSKLAKRLKNIQDNRNNQLVVENQLSVDLTQVDNIQAKSFSKLKYLYLKCIFFKKVLKNRNSLKIYFNRYRNNINKIKKKYSIENNNIFINNKNDINIQMAKNLNINFISQNDNYKYFLLFKLFTKKEQRKSNIIPKYFYKYYYKTNNIQKEDCDLKKIRILKAIINKKENKNQYILRNKLKEWKMRGVLFKMKGAAKALKKKKKLKKKIRDRLAKATLDNLKNKTSSFQSAHEFSYKIDKIEKKEDDKEENKEKDDIQNINENVIDK